MLTDADQNRPARSHLPSFNRFVGGRSASTLTYRLLRLSNTLGIYSSRRYRSQHGVTLPEWRVLSIIAVQEMTSARDNSRALATDKAWVGLTVQKLERGGFVRRISDAEDGRRTLVNLTRQGRKVHDASMANARRRQKGCWACLVLMMPGG